METKPESCSPILIVDDDIGMLQSIEAILLSCGLPKPVLISDSRNVIPLIKEHPFQVVLLDLIMPHKNGIEVLSEIKNEFPDIQCVMITGVDKTEKAVDAIKLGAFDYLVKPVDVDKLRCVINTALKIGSQEMRLKKKREGERQLGYQERLKKTIIESEELKSENAMLLENLKNDKTLFKKTINSLSAAIFIIEPETFRIVECNRSAEVLFQYSRDELIGKTTDIFHVHELPLKEFCKKIQTAIETTGVFEQHDFEMKKSDGTVFPGDYSMVPIEDDHGKQIADVLVVRDITERKRFEEQIRQAQKLEAIGTLSSGIAHDFNNILFPIIGYTELAMDEVPDDSPILSNLQGIFQAAQRAKELVKQILSFSRQQDQEKKPIKIQYIIKETLNLLKKTLPSSIDIRQSIYDCRPVMADPTQIHQITMNLCINAFHAMPEQKGCLDVTLNEMVMSPDDISSYPDMKPGTYLKLSVSDTGIGMSPDLIQRIFDPYFTTKKANQGTGLGLSIVHRIVKSHEGYIRVYSEPCKGTIFHIYFPVIERYNFTHENHIKESLPVGNEKILVVDDETAILSMITQMLKGLGYQVTDRASAFDTIEAFRHHPNSFDLVITDMTMPHMNGVELSRELLRIRPDIPIVLFSGFSELITKEKIMETGIKDFIMKPVLKKELATVVRKVLDRRIN